MLLISVVLLGLLGLGSVVAAKGVASAADQQPVYLAQYMYPWGSNCQGNPERTEATAFGACIGGVDETGNPTTSTQSVLLSVNASVASYLVNTFQTPDCSGTPIYHYSTDQLLNDCATSMKFMITDVDNLTPWAGSNQGVVVKTFPYSAANCAGYAEVFQAISFDYCMSYQHPDYPTVTNLRYSACNSDSVSFTLYGNYSCDAASTVQVVSTSPSTCRVCPSGDNCYPQGFWYQNYESISCNSV